MNPSYTFHKNAARSDGSTLGEHFMKAMVRHTIRTTVGAAVHGGRKTLPPKDNEILINYGHR